MNKELHDKLKVKNEELLTDEEKIFMEYAALLIEKRRATVEAKFVQRQKLRDEAAKLKATEAAEVKAVDDKVVVVAEPAQNMNTDFTYDVV